MITRMWAMVRKLCLKWANHSRPNWLQKKGKKTPTNQNRHSYFLPGHIVKTRVIGEIWSLLILCQGVISLLHCQGYSLQNKGSEGEIFEAPLSSDCCCPHKWGAPKYYQIVKGCTTRNARVYRVWCNTKNVTSVCRENIVFKVNVLREYLQCCSTSSDVCSK